ncbi:MAG: hypothetical protein ACP5UV_07535, partial [Thermoplasmata archaeon]
DQMNKLSEYAKKKQEIERSNLFLNLQDARKYFIFAENRKRVMENFSQLERRIEDHEKKIRELNSLRQKHDEYVELSGKKSALERRLKDLENSETGYRLTEDRIKRLKSEISTLETQIQKMKAEIEKNTGIGTATAESIDDVRKAADLENERMKAEIKKIDLKIKENEQNMKLLSEYSALLNGKGLCPVCGTALGSEKVDDIVRHYSDDIDKVKGEIKELMERRDKLQELQQKEEKLLRFLDSRTVHEFLINSRSIMEKNNEVNTLNESFEALKNKHLEYTKLQDEFSKMDLETLRDFDNRYQALKYETDGTDMAAMEEEKKKINTELSDLNQSMISIEQKIPEIKKTNENDLERLEKDYREASEK